MRSPVRILALLLVLTVFSCKKNSEVDLNPNLNIADNLVIAESVFNYPVTLVLKALADTGLKNHHYTMIDSVYVISTSNGTQLTFNFQGRWGGDTINRQGRIYADIAGDPLTEGSTIILTFDNYYEEDHNVTAEGDTLVNSGPGPGNTILFTNRVTHGILHHSDQTTTRYECVNRFYVNSLTWNSGNMTPFSWYIKCEASGVTTESRDYRAETADSLYCMSTCPWVVCGHMEVIAPTSVILMGKVDYITEDGCSDQMVYDFGGNFFYLRKNYLYLHH